MFARGKSAPYRSFVKKSITTCAGSQSTVNCDPPVPLRKPVVSKEMLGMTGLGPRSIGVPVTYRVPEYPTTWPRPAMTGSGAWPSAPV